MKPVTTALECSRKTGIDSRGRGVRVRKKQKMLAPLCLSVRTVIFPSHLKPIIFGETFREENGVYAEETKRGEARGLNSRVRMCGVCAKGKRK